MKNYFYMYLDNDKKFTFFLFQSESRRGTWRNQNDMLSQIEEATGRKNVTHTGYNFSKDWIFIDNAKNRDEQEVELDQSRIIDCRPNREA